MTSSKSIISYRLKSNILLEISTNNPKGKIKEPSALLAIECCVIPIKDLLYSTKDIAVAALLVSSKMEETFKKIKDIILIAYSIDPLDQSYNKESIDSTRKKIIQCEGLILKAIDFDFDVDEIHICYTKIVKLLKANDQICKDGWLILNDSFQSLLPLQFPPLVLITGSILLSKVLYGYDSHSPSSKILALAASDLKKLRSDGFSVYEKNIREHKKQGVDLKSVYTKEFDNLNILKMNLHGKWWKHFSVSSDEITEFTTQMLELYSTYNDIFNMFDSSVKTENKSGCVDERVRRTVNSIISTL
ncbi:hypothetical protein BB560_001159 [Smittium megazygosporum]|uniref:Cyclin N-terminal domain-containing protein n=1 Tax=Smittium megazygosporum TaxID=133381 RepID=A0A2T9ZIC8_9FUNG|nr:hypothetical protein BB560_001159 [Smittium megazygosporum]